MAKHLIDSDLYIDLIRTGEILPVLRELYEQDAPGIYFSSVVVQELMAGARLESGKRTVETLVAPFERTGRIVTPTHSQWKECGIVLSRIFTLKPEFRTRVASLVNDCLLASSARSLGATLYTRNREDFVLIRSIRQFSLVVIP